MISCIVQRKGRDCFCSTLLSLSCSLFVKVNKPRRETEQELRIWPSDVAAQLEPMLWRAVPRNTAPIQMKSLGGAFGLRGCWGTWISRALCFAGCGNIVSSTTAVGSANHGDWAAPGVGCWGLTTSCQCRDTFGGQQRGLLLSGEGCGAGILLYIGGKDEAICNKTNLDGYSWTNLSSEQHYQGLSINIAGVCTLRCPAQMLPMTLTPKKAV